MMIAISVADEKLLAKWLIDIYNLGDADECSWKHIGHGMAALLAFDNWKQTDDYSRPIDRQMTRPEEVKLGALWDCVKKIIVRNGKQNMLDSLHDIAQKYPQLMYLDTFLDYDWLTYKHGLLAQNLVVRGDE